MALQFPSDTNGYPGQVKFTVVDENDVAGTEISLYLPSGALFADRVEYENVSLGAAVGFADDGGPEGESFTDIISNGDLAALLVSEGAKALGPRVGQLARARSKKAPNPNTRALFKQVSLRTFQFNFKMIPTSEDEAKNIKDIIQEFRKEMYPEDIADLGNGSLGYKFPNRFKVEMFYNNDTNVMAPKIAPAYLEAFSASYNPSSQAFLQKSGGQVYFAETDINLTFTESKAISRKDVLDGF